MSVKGKPPELRSLDFITFGRYMLVKQVWNWDCGKATSTRGRARDTRIGAFFNSACLFCRPQTRAFAINSIPRVNFRLLEHAVLQFLSFGVFFLPLPATRIQQSSFSACFSPFLETRRFTLFPFPRVASPLLRHADSSILQFCVSPLSLPDTKITLYSVSSCL